MSQSFDPARTSFPAPTFSRTMDSGSHVNPRASNAMAFKPSARKSKEHDDAEPDMLPIMGLMCILIPLLLPSSQSIILAMVELMQPNDTVTVADPTCGTGGHLIGHLTFIW